MGTDINGYILVDKLTTADAGMCRWSFAKKDDHEYFIKEFLSPKYPVDEGRLGPELTKRMRENADAFYEHRRRFYEKLRTCRTGNVVVNLDFFRCGSKYYAVTDKVGGTRLDIAQVVDLTPDSKRTLIRSILYSMAQIHNVGIVHSDLKPENILLKETKTGYCAAKIIDFDAGFFEEDAPEIIEGSQNYFSPEAVLKTNGHEVTVTTKADVFALGLLFHQYWCGRMPGFSSTYHYAAEAVLKGEQLQLDPHIPEDIQTLIRGMLSQGPEERPTALQAWEQLGGGKEEKDPAKEGSSEKTPSKEAPAEVKKTPRELMYAPSDDDL